MTQSFESRKELARQLLFLLAILTGCAFIRQFVQDDAFITYRYSENLFNGHGLVFNPGERVEGYTNFLWAIWLTIPFYLGIDVVPFSIYSGIALFPLTLYGTFKLARQIDIPDRFALLAALLAGANASFSAYATGGLETQLQACCTTWSAYLVLRLVKEPGIWRALGLGLVLSAACLTRMDGFLVAFLSIAYLLWERKKDGKLELSELATVLGPLALLVGGWLAWKISFYGGIMPNTFYAKVPTMRARLGGIAYVGMFLIAYGLLPFIPLFLAKSFKRTWATPSATSFLVLIAALWTLYVIYVGGDFMEFRFMMPITPILCVLVLASLLSWKPKPQLAAVLALAILAVVQPFWYRSGFGVNTIEVLEDPVRGTNSPWVVIGKLLRNTFGEMPVKTAIMPAGAVPFYSQMYTLDMLGLNDKWVARNGEHYLDKPGHHRIAPFSYLKEQQVDLVLGHPFVLDYLPKPEQDLKVIDELLMRPSPADFKKGAAIAYAPTPGKGHAPVLVLRPRPEILNVMRDRGWVIRMLSE